MTVAAYMEACNAHYYATRDPLGAAPGSYWDEFLDDEGRLDAGPLWFVGVLLIFSLAYAGGVRLRRRHPVRGRERDLTAAHLVLVAAVVARSAARAASPPESSIA